MSLETRDINVGGLQVQIVRKAIKNLHLGVYPPHGRIRVAAPMTVSDNAVRLAVVRNLGWIRRQRDRFEAQPRESRREMAGGETHYFFGRRYRLRLVVSPERAIVIRRKSLLEIHAPIGTTAAQREQILQTWYRDHLKRRIAPLLAEWQPRLGVSATHWRVRRMRTRWGTSNPDSRRLLFNLELAKKPVRCLEFLVVHELVHLIERHHSERFLSLMDQHFPRWRRVRAELNAAPLAHEDWAY
jgi:predicted metal-dependent hydrolase